MDHRQHAWGALRTTAAALTIPSYAGSRQPLPMPLHNKTNTVNSVAHTKNASGLLSNVTHQLVPVPPISSATQRQIWWTGAGTGTVDIAQQTCSAGRQARRQPMTPSPMSCASKARSGASLATKQVLLSRHLVPEGSAAPATTRTCLVGAAWQRLQRAWRLIQLLQVVLPLRSRGVCCRCPRPYVRPVAMQRPHAACQHESQQRDSLWREPSVVVTARRRQVRPAAAAAAVERRFVRHGRAAAAAAGWRRINSSGRLLHACHSSAGQDSRGRCGEAGILRTVERGGRRCGGTITECRTRQQPSLGRRILKGAEIVPRMHGWKRSG